MQDLNITMQHSMIPLSPSFFAFSEDSVPEDLILGVIQAIMTFSLPPNHERCCFQLRAQVSCALNTYEVNHSYFFKTSKSTKPPLFTTFAKWVL